MSWTQSEEKPESCRAQAGRVLEQIDRVEQAVTRLHAQLERDLKAGRREERDDTEDPLETAQDQIAIAVRLIHVGAMALSSGQGTWDRFRTKLPEHAFGRTLAGLPEGDLPNAAAVRAAIAALPDEAEEQDAAPIGAAIGALAAVNDYAMRVRTEETEHEESKGGRG